MKTAVIYRSMTGHSKKIAAAVASGLNAPLFDVKKNPDLGGGIDILFIAGGIYSGKSLPEMIAFVKKLDSSKVKKAVLITSSAADKCGQDEVREILLSNNIAVADEEYRCRGGFLFIKLGHPNKKEIAGAVDFAKNFLNAD